MEYRRLGKTNLRVGTIGFGGIPIQRKTTAEAVRIVEYALEKGINFIDSARNYRDSEEKIGQAIRGKRDRVILATKSMARTSGKMREDIETSLKCFGTDYIELYQCHNVRTQEELDLVLGPGGAMEELIKAQQAGKIGHIGLSGHRPPMVFEAIKTGAFTTIQIPYNFIERAPEEGLLAYAKEKDLGVIVMKPLAGGAFHRADLALRYLLEQEVTVIIPGMDSREQVEQNALLSGIKQRLTPEDTACLQEEAEKIGKHFCRRCDYCKPCPQGVDISSIFTIHTYYKRYSGMGDIARERYQGLDIKADACVSCGLCETRCPYFLPIRQMLQEVHHDLG